MFLLFRLIYGWHLMNHGFSSILETGWVYTPQVWQIQENWSTYWHTMCSRLTQQPGIITMIPTEVLNRVSNAVKIFSCRMHTARLKTVCASVTVATTRCWGGVRSPNKQVFSDHHQMSLAGGGDTLPCDLYHDAFDVTYPPHTPWTESPTDWRTSRNFVAGSN